MEAESIEVAETVPASRKLGEERARELVRDAQRVYVAKGRKLEVFGADADADEVVPKLLGSTGNLRAPTLKVGDQLLVGFDEDAYRDVFG